VNEKQMQLGCDVLRQATVICPSLSTAPASQTAKPSLLEQQILSEALVSNVGRNCCKEKVSDAGMFLLDGGVKCCSVMTAPDLHQ